LVTCTDGSIVVLDSARVSADTVVGFVDGEPRHIPLSQVTALRAREGAEARTNALLAAASVGAMTVLMVDLVANKGPGKPGCPAFNSGEDPLRPLNCPITAP
jgi:hypothetical protein